MAISQIAIVAIIIIAIGGLFVATVKMSKRGSGSGSATGTSSSSAGSSSGGGNGDGSDSI